MCIYSIVDTLLMSFQSERVVADCVAVGKFFKSLISGGLVGIMGIAERAGNILGNNFENEIISQVVCNVVGAVVFLVIIVAILAFLFISGRFIAQKYKEYCFDEISLIEALISVVVVVWFANVMPLNVVLILILSYVLYLFIRLLKK